MEGHPLGPIFALPGFTAAVVVGGAVGALPTVLTQSMHQKYNAFDENDAITKEGRRQEQCYEKVARKFGQMFDAAGALLSVGGCGVIGEQYGRSHMIDITYYGRADSRVDASFIKNCVVAGVIGLGCTAVGSALGFLGNRTVRAYSNSPEAIALRSQRDREQAAVEAVRQKDEAERQRLERIAELKDVRKRGLNQAHAAAAKLRELEAADAPIPAAPAVARAKPSKPSRGSRELRALLKAQ